MAGKHLDPNQKGHWAEETKEDAEDYDRVPKGALNGSHWARHRKPGKAN